MTEVKTVKDISKNPQISIEKSKRKLILHINCNTMHMSNNYTFRLKKKITPHRTIARVK